MVSKSYLYPLLIFLGFSIIIQITTADTITLFYDDFTFNYVGWSYNGSSTVTPSLTSNRFQLAMEKSYGTDKYTLYFYPINYYTANITSLSFSIGYYFAHQDAVSGLSLTTRVEIKLVNSSGIYTLHSDQYTTPVGYACDWNPTIPTLTFPNDPKGQTIYIFTYFNQMAATNVYTQIDNIQIQANYDYLTFLDQQTFSSTAEGWTGGSVSGGVYTASGTSTSYTLKKFVPSVGVSPAWVYFKLTASGSYSSSRTFTTTVTFTNSTGSYTLLTYSASGTSYSFADYICFSVQLTSGSYFTITQTSSGTVSSHSVSVDDFYLVPFTDNLTKVTVYDENTETYYSAISWDLLRVGYYSDGYYIPITLPYGSFNSSGYPYFYILNTTNISRLFSIYNMSGTIIKRGSVIQQNSTTIVYLPPYSMIALMSFTIYDSSGYWSNLNNVSVLIQKTTGLTIDIAELDLANTVTFYLTENALYHLTLFNPAYGDYRFMGKFYANSGTLFISIARLPSPNQTFAKVNWTAIYDPSLGTLNITGNLSTPSDITIRVYNSSLLLVSEISLSGVSDFLYSPTINTSLSYTVSLLLGTGWKESRIVVGSADRTLDFPLITVLNPKIFFLCILTAISFIWTPKYKGIGAVITVSMAVLFAYFQWIEIPVVVITGFLLLAVLYAISRKEGEE